MITPLEPEGLKQSPTKKPEVPDLEKIDIQDEAPIVTNDSVNWLDLIKEYTRQSLITSILKQIKGGTMEQEFNFANFLTGFIVRRLIGIGSGFLLTIGFTESSLLSIVGGIVSAIVYLATSWLSSKKLLNTTPPTPSTQK